MEAQRILRVSTSKKEALQEFDAQNAPNVTSTTNLDMTSNKSILQNPNLSIEKSDIFEKIDIDEDIYTRVFNMQGEVANLNRS